MHVCVRRPCMWAKRFCRRRRCRVVDAMGVCVCVSNKGAQNTKCPHRCVCALDTTLFSVSLSPTKLVQFSYCNWNRYMYIEYVFYMELYRFNGTCVLALLSNFGCEREICASCCSVVFSIRIQLTSLSSNHFIDIFDDSLLSIAPPSPLYLPAAFHLFRPL